MQAVARNVTTFEPQHTTPRLKDELGPWAPVPLAWTAAVEELGDARAWVVAHRLLEIAGRWVGRWRWTGTVRALAERVASSVVCSVRTFWSGWRRLKEAGLVEQCADGWALAARAGARVCMVLAGERPSVGREGVADAQAVAVEDRKEAQPEAVVEAAAGGAADVKKERVREIGDGSLVSSNQRKNLSTPTPPPAAAPAPTTPEPPTPPDPWQGPASVQASSGVPPSRRTASSAKPRNFEVLGHRVSSLALEEIDDEELASLPGEVIVELGKPQRLPSGQYKPNPWAKELIARLSGTSPERRRELQQTRRRAELERYEAQKRIDRKREIVAGMRGDFPKRWKDFVDYVGRRWGVPAIDRKYLAARRVVEEVNELDRQATDEVWHEAIGVLMQKPEVREPFSYFIAVLRSLVEERLAQLPPGDEVLAGSILRAPSLDLPADEYLARWLDRESGDK